MRSAGILMICLIALLPKVVDAGKPTGEIHIEPARSAPTFEALWLEPPKTRYTGEPISLSLKDADVVSVVKTFSKLTGLNVVLHPDVSGRVTLELREVPWDQALDLILVINGLGWQLEGNVLFVAPLSKLPL